MSRFFVGQRVRIKWSLNWPELEGLCGIILSRLPPDAFDMRGMKAVGDWRVKPDGYPSSLLPYKESPTGYCNFSPREEQLEPATDANEKVSWSECAWMPEHLRESA